MNHYPASELPHQTPPPIKVLGRISVCDGHTLVDLGSLKQRALFALLLINAGTVVSTSRIISSIWGDHPPTSVMSTLYSYVSRLRRAIGGPYTDRRLGLFAVRFEAPGYVLDVDPSQTDVAWFRTSVNQGRDLYERGELYATRSTLADALDLWTGTPYRELDTYEFAAMERTNLEQLRLQAREAWADACLALGLYDEVVWELGKEVRQDPVRERLGSRLMIAQYRTGRPAEALLTYERIRGHLAAELGADVSKELQELHQAILRQDVMIGEAVAPGVARVPTAAPPAPPAPQPVIQATAPSGEPASRLNPAPPEPPRRSLGFVGRDRELAYLRTATGSIDRPHIVLVIGERGSGKSRLLTEFERELAAREIETVRVRCAEQPAGHDNDVWLQAVGKILRSRCPEPWSASSGARDMLCRLEQEGSAAGGGGHPAFRDAICRALADAAATKPLVLCVEDLHHAPAASFRLLQWLVTEERGARLVVIGTMRENQVSASPARHRALADLLHEDSVECLRLSTLSLSDTQALARRLMKSPVSWELVSVLSHASGRNPYLLTRLLKPGFADAYPSDRSGSIPFELKVVLQSWLLEHSPEVRAVLEICAIIGPVIDRRLLDAVLTARHQAGSVSDVLQSGLVAVNPEDVNDLWFVHGVMRDLLLSELDAGRRGRLHLAVADALVESRKHGTYGPIGQAVSHHSAQAAAYLGPKDAIRPLVSLADQAQSRERHGEARVWLAQAVAVLQRTYPRTEALVEAIAGLRQRISLLERVLAAQGPGIDKLESSPR